MVTYEIAPVILGEIENGEGRIRIDVFIKEDMEGLYRTTLYICVIFQASSNPFPVVEPRVAGPQVSTNPFAADVFPVCLLTKF